jgi:hypothetical protein
VWLVALVGSSWDLCHRSAHLPYPPYVDRCDLPTRLDVLFGGIFNVTNRANFANPSGDRSNADFLRLTTLSTSTNARLVQFGGRYSF